MKTKEVVSIWVATFVLGGIIGAGVMKGVMTVQIKQGLEELQENFKAELEEDLRASLRRTPTYGRTAYATMDKGLFKGRPCVVGETKESPSDVIFNNRKDAWDVVRSMDSMIEERGLVTVGDFYRIIGLDGKYMDETLVWKNLDDMTSRNNEYGVSLNFPKPIDLKKEKTNEK